ncbi:hypothetical protein DRF65_05720 [Chryseobacterium pennae]|uniref:Uncharacterized protein n=1 Tax=Chryseobacterium pennae TaxID=2258962 RepID=A0A3D9CCF1_9FLAO|nr:hypothetical protein [Chryseobacterium pennae]REC63590.1 hypothetical protein DRF65_05720 [Chryseobacterium pennae]
MSTAFLTPKGQVIKSSGIDRLGKQNATYSLTNMRFDAEGQIVEFTVNDALPNLDNTYIFTGKNHYYLASQRDDGRQGFLKKSYFISLKNDPVNAYKVIHNINNIDSIWFDNHLELGSTGDIFQIGRLIFDDNLSTYYTFLDQSFKMGDDTIQYNDYNTYPTVVNGDLQSPKYNVRTVSLKSRLDTEEGHFFEKNFNKIRTSTNLQLSAKKVLYMKMMNICFAIYWIRQEVLDILAMDPIASIEEASKNGTIDQKIGQEYKFQEIDRVIGHLLRDWGFAGLDNTRELIPIPQNDYFYDGYYEAFSNYSSALDNFYHNLREKNEDGLFPLNPPPSNYSFMYPSPYYLGYHNSFTIPLQGAALLKWRSDERLKVLKSILPPSALSLLPYSIREGLIKDFIKNPVFSQEDEDQCLRIMSSFYSVPEDGESFLNFLLQIGNDNLSNFEILEKKFSVGRIMRIAPIIGFFLQKKDYRTNYIFLIYKLWKRSKYNMYYFSNSMNPENNINTQSFFLTPGQGLDYYNDAVDNRISNLTIEYGTVWQGNSEPYSNQEDIKVVRSIVRSYTDPIIKGIILQSSMSNNTFYTSSDGDVKPGTVGFPQPLIFHLYQPITLHGLKIDEKLSANFPTVPYIPAFLWYYTRDYQLMKEMDATLNFALGVAFDVGLFFISGGVGIIKSFSYLRYITVIGRAFKAGQGAAYTVLVLEGMGSAAEIFTLLSSTCTRYYDFMKEKADAGEDTTKYEALHKMFFYLTILGAGASLAMKSLAINQAKLVKGASYFDSLPLEVRNSVNSLAGVEVAQIENFRQNRIGAHQEITSKFDLWGEGKKNVFFDDFKNAPDDVLLQMNNADVIANWDKLYTANIIDRNLIEVIKDNVRTNNIINFYQSYKTRQALSALSTQKRLKFLDEFETASITQINEIKGNIYFVDSWKQLRFEPNLIDEFKACSIADKIELCNKFGRLEKKLFDGFRRNSGKITEYISKNAASRKLLEDNKNFWLSNNYRYEYIDSFKDDILDAVDVFKDNDLFLNVVNKVKAEKLLNETAKFQKGNIIEMPMRIYLKDRLDVNEELMFSVDIVFRKADNSRVLKREMLDIDGLLIDKTSNKIKVPYSAKMDVKKSFKGKGSTAYTDAQKLEFFRNLPINIDEAKQFIIGQKQNVWGQVKKGNMLSQIHYIEIRYIDVNNAEQFMSLQQFKQKLQPTPYVVGDFTEINPNTFGTTREDLIESLYYRIITD